MNAQPWHFVVIDDEWLKGRIRELCEDAERRFYEKVEGDLGEWLQEKGSHQRSPS